MYAEKRKSNIIDLSVFLILNFNFLTLAGEFNPGQTGAF